MNKTLASLALISLTLALGRPTCAEAAPGDSITAHVVWRFQTGGEVNSAPVIADGVLYCGSMNAAFFALDAETGAVKWKFTGALFPVSSKAAVHGDVVCLVSGNTLFGLDRRTGAERWRYSARNYRPVYLMDLTDYHRSSPYIDGDIAFFGDDWGDLNGVDTRTGALAFQYTTGSSRPIRSTPVVNAGVVYFGDWEGAVYAVSIADRKPLWTHTLANCRAYYGAIVSEFVVQDGVLYFGSQHDLFAPLDIATGKEVWRYVDPNKTYLPATPLVRNGNVIIASTIFTNSVICLSRGSVVWSFKGSGIFFTKPAVSDSVLAINSTSFGQTGYLYLLDADSGKLINTVAVERATPSAPAIDGGKLYLGSGDGCIYALNLRELIAPHAGPP